MENASGPQDDPSPDAATDLNSSSDDSSGGGMLSIVVFVGSLVLIAGFFLSYFKIGPFAPGTGDQANADQRKPRNFTTYNPQDRSEVVIHFWDGIEAEFARSRIEPDDHRNIRRVDYVGSQQCQKCHAEIHDHWSNSFHNISYFKPQEGVIKNDFSKDALVSHLGKKTKFSEFVKGDFSGQSSIDYLKGRGTFFEEDGEYRMQLDRDGLRRVFRVTGVIDGRFYQSYSGRLIQGPEPEDHVYRGKDLSLPFSYSLDSNQWVPPVHQDGGYVTDDDHPDPFGDGGNFLNFDARCVVCHTTRPFGDWVIADSGKTRAVHHAGRAFGFLLGPYIQQNHPNILDPKLMLQDVPDDTVQNILDEMDNVSVEQGSISVDSRVSCEACHLGTRQHVVKSTPEKNGQPTRYFPSSQFLVIRKPEGKTDAEAEEIVWGRSASNLNFMCARCHTDERDRFANSMSTWYGASMSDAGRGHCYHAAEQGSGPQSSLTCIACHDPHKSSGSTWSETPQQDDARCVKCHTEFDNAEAVKAHTHHETGTAGSHCMDCHMPKMVEGRDGLLRTHMIFSPTNTAMLESNQPNACNLCHLEEPIDWTIDHLNKWYRSKEDVNVAAGSQGGPGDKPLVSDERITASYPQREGKVGLGWLDSNHGPTRLVATAALCQANARWALADLIEALDDKELANRKFAQKYLEKMLNASFEEFGYRYYMAPSERSAPIQKIRDKFGSAEGKEPEAGE